jgi:hypothetical protein
MNKKLLGMSVCILLIATAVPAVESLKNITLNATIPSTAQTNKAANWTEMQMLLASDGAAYDCFGGSVSLSGDTALIGAPFDNNEIGSAYVFIRNGSTWTQQAKLIASDGADSDEFGWAVSLFGDTALIGAWADEDNGWQSGSAYVFIRTGTIWTQQAKLLPADGAEGDVFGHSVSINGDTALIGAWDDNDNGNYSGSAYVFTRTGTTWIQQAKLLASDGAAGDQFGYSVSLSGDTALIGAPADDDNGTDSGSAYIFTRTGTTWTQQAKLLASDGTIGDLFGFSVSFTGDTALIGALGDGDNSSGSAYVFTRTGTTWTQQTKLLASDGAAGDYFGYSISLTDGTALIGALQDDDNGVDSGSAYVFTRTGTTWTQQTKLLASNGVEDDNFGGSVSLSGDTALIGAYSDDDNGYNSGSAYIFTREGGTPNLQINITTEGIGVNAVITNDGTANATGVTWQIHVKGGIFGHINTTVNGTIDVPIGETRTVTTGLFLGLGPFTIIARANDVEKTGTGKILLFYVLGVT